MCNHCRKSSKLTSSSPIKRRQPLLLKNVIVINEGGEVGTIIVEMKKKR
jgi:hypothetical protein